VGMDYDTRLLDGDEIVDHTGVQDLANLAADSELTLDTFALQATRGVFRWLKEKGVDPTLLSNASHYKDAVAYEAVVRLARAGYLPGVDIEEMRAARDEALKVRPEFASTDAARTSAEGIPAVGHVNPALFSGDTSVSLPGFFNDDYPSAL
jgi:hypothetical protein